MRWPPPSTSPRRRTCQAAVHCAELPHPSRRQECRLRAAVGLGLQPGLLSAWLAYAGYAVMSVIVLVVYALVLRPRGVGRARRPRRGRPLVSCCQVKQLVLISADLMHDFMSPATTCSSPTCPSTTTSGTTAPRRTAPATQPPSLGSAPSVLTGSSPAWSTLADARRRRIRLPVPDAGDIVEESVRMQGSRS
jgi:hypothetical protein